MEKYYLINQPPFSEKFTLLVDDISDNENWGKTIDLEKIKYNMKILGEDLNIDIQIRQCLAEDGTTTVFPYGRYIVVFQIRKDNKEGEMSFFDFETDSSKDEIEKILNLVYSENIIKAWFGAFDFLVENFTCQNDLVELYKPEY